MNFNSIISWFSVQSDLDAAIDELGAEINQLRAHSSELETKLTQANQLITELTRYKVLHEQSIDRSKAVDSFAFDFNSVRVISIERMIRGDSNTPSTIIGWLNLDGTTHEWYYDCNQDAHEELVRQFKKHKGI
jgi:hypothetical protein